MTNQTADTKSGQRSPARRAIQARMMHLLLGLVRSTQVHRRTQFEQLPTATGRVVFLGDSITEQGIWEEWFPDVPVLNRGVGGEIASEVLDRLDTAISNPKAVFLLIGTNDLASGIPLDTITANVRRIILEIRARSPRAPIVVQSVMPRALPYRSEIDALNRRYRELVAEQDPDVTYLDLWPTLATADGALRPEFSADKLHLNGAGYAAWVEVIRPKVTDILAG